MQGQIVEMLQDINPNNRGYDWYQKYITTLRMWWVPLVNPQRCRINKEIILSMQPMNEIMDSFKDKEFKKGTQFLPLGIWNRMLNIIVEEMTKTPPQVELKAEDSQAISDRKEDILLLRNKHILENDINTIGAKVGDPAEIVGADKFKGNIEEFERLGLDPNDPDDITFYEQSGFQRLKYEIAGQNLINVVMKLNRFDQDTLRKFVIDILAVLTISMQTYVDAITGEIKYRYLYPEEVYGIFGDTEDGSTDICNGYQRSSTVREWLGSVGNDFVWDRDWRQMLAAINYRNGLKFTGFIRNGYQYNCWGNENWTKEANTGEYPASNVMDWNQAYNFRVYTGYIEWPTMDATATYLAKNGTGELIPGQINYETQLTKKETTSYFKESFYQEQYYESYFLATGFANQWIYKYQKTYFQHLEGAFDEVSKGTIMTFRYEGRSAAEISRPYIDLCNLTFYRMKWVVWHSKPQKEQHVFEELLQVAKGLQRLYPQQANSKLPPLDTILQQVIQYKRENMVDIRAYPQIEGKTYPQLPPTEGAKGGIDNIAVSMQAVEQWGEMQIAEKIGLNDIRLGQQQNDRQGYKQGVMETQSSLNSTGYIYRMIQYLKMHVATITCNYAQDIVRFEATVPYKWLLKLLGEDDFENLKLLGNFAQHRYGLLIRDYNANLERQRLMAAADKALDTGDGRGGITIGQWGILMMQEDYKKGLRLLDFYKYKEAKKLRKQQLQDMQIQQQNQLQLEQARQQTEQMKGQLAITKEQVAADGYKYAADKQYAAKVDTKQLGITGETQKIAEKTDAEKQVAENEATIRLQEALHP